MTNNPDRTSQLQTESSRDDVFCTHHNYLEAETFYYCWKLRLPSSKAHEIWDYCRKWIQLQQKFKIAMTRGGLRVFEGHGQTKMKGGGGNMQRVVIYLKWREGFFTMFYPLEGHFIMFNLPKDIQEGTGCIFFFKHRSIGGQSVHQC